MAFNFCLSVAAEPQGLLTRISRQPIMPERSIARSVTRPDTSRRRATFVVLMLVSWMLIIGVRLAYLQVWQHEELGARARRQQQRETGVNPERGAILDRQGRELASSVAADSFFIVPQEIADVRETAQQLAGALDSDGERLAARLTEAQAKRKKFVWVARKVEPEVAARVKSLPLAGVHVRKEPKRYYPNGALAAHLLGFVGTDDAGLAGVEQFQDVALNGEAGKVWTGGDGRRRTYESREIAARPGQSVTLTIDQNIQHHTELMLAAAVAKARAKSGTAVVLNPQTGEILALANAPSFDPNDMQTLAPEVRANQALQNIYEPGSTFKLVAYAAALEEKLARPEDRIDCQMGAITVAGRVIRDHTAYGALTVTEALAKSSNVAAIKLGLRVGDERMYQYIRRFGFGTKTGIELAGETSGLLRPVARWQKSSIGSIAIGQEIGVTPMQMAAAFAAVANGGVRVAPHLVKEIRDAEGQVIKRTEPESHRVISEETARTLRPMLESVTLKGTAKRAQPDGYTSAGKTGTAQKIDPKTRSYSRTKHVASFVGFAPVERPAVVIAVAIDEPIGAYHGGEVAAPIFRDIAETVLPYLNVQPDTEFRDAVPPVREEIAERHDERAPLAEMSGESQRQQRAPQTDEIVEETSFAVVHQPQRVGAVGELIFAAASERSLLMPNLRGQSVRDVARVCAQLGLELEAHGEGHALRQTPAAGAKIAAGQSVRIEFGRSD
ncbi:MAG: transpeptidase family protein [Pyrinomonadaceae bacterium]|nr:transpeptidase family protein [Pyrinomonadaceae bacterium]